MNQQAQFIYSVRGNDMSDLLGGNLTKLVTHTHAFLAHYFGYKTGRVDDAFSIFFSISHLLLSL